jgi:isocitrate dehydrogenase kinase/phosphatase
MNQVLSDSRLANLGAQAILERFNAFHSAFKDINRRAAERFLNRDWHGLQDDATKRLDLYRQAADAIEDIIWRKPSSTPSPGAYFPRSVSTHG